MGQRNNTQGTTLINPQEWQDSESYKTFDHASVTFIAGHVSSRNMWNLPLLLMHRKLFLRAGRLGTIVLEISGD